MGLMEEEKTMRFKHEGSMVTLVGVNSNLETCSIVSAQAIHILIQR
jgi:hypothetical protein